MINVNIGRYNEKRKDDIYLFSYSFIDSIEDQKVILSNIKNYTPIALTQGEIVDKHLTSIYLYEQCLEEISKHLNTHYQKTFSNFYWHLISCTWLSRTIVMIVDRWIKLKKFNQNDMVYKSNIFLHYEIEKQNFDDYRYYSCFSDYNYFINSKILSEMKFNNWELTFDNQYFPMKKTNPWADSNKQRDFRKINLGGFGPWECKIINFFSGKVKNNLNHIKKNFNPTSLGEEILGTLKLLDWIKTILPTDFYSNQLIKTMFISPHSPEKILLGTFSGGEISQNIAIANIVEKNQCKLILTQHGSAYVDAFTTTTNYLREYAYNNFISWGPKDHKLHPPYQMISLPSPVFAKIRLRRILSAKSKKIIFASTAIFVKDGNGASTIHADHVNLFYQFMRDFIGQALNSSFQHRFYFRPRLTHTLGSFQFRQFITEEFPNLNCITSANITPELGKADLVVVDNIGSILHKCLAANTPTIILWPKDSNLFIGELDSVFEILKQEKVLFHNVNDAISHIENIHKNIDRWWQGKKIQQARKQFVKTICPVDYLYLFKWLNIMKKFRTQT